MEQNNIVVPDYVIKALIDVRDESKFNMYGATDVVNRMSELHHHKAFLWMIDMDRLERIGDVKVHSERYMTALLAMGEVRTLADKLENM